MNANSLGSQVEWCRHTDLSALFFVNWSLKYHFSLDCPLFVITDVIVCSFYWNKLKLTFWLNKWFIEFS